MSVNGTKVGVLHESDDVGLGSLTERQDSVGLETQPRIYILRNLLHNTIDRGFRDNQIDALLEPSNLA